MKMGHPNSGWPSLSIFMIFLSWRTPLIILGILSLWTTQVSIWFSRLKGWKCVLQASQHFFFLGYLWDMDDLKAPTEKLKNIKSRISSSAPEWWSDRSRDSWGVPYPQMLQCYTGTGHLDKLGKRGDHMMAEVGHRDWETSRLATKAFSQVGGH